MEHSPGRRARTPACTSRSPRRSSAGRRGRAWWGSSDRPSTRPRRWRRTRPGSSSTDEKYLLVPTKSLPGASLAHKCLCCRAIAASLTLAAASWYRAKRWPAMRPHAPQEPLEATPGALRKTPLHAIHRESGAKMVPFGGWDMPVEYSGLIAEHLAVRRAAGLFDVSHMGEFEIEGRGRAGLPAAGDLERRREARGRPGAVFGPHPAERSARGRRHPLPAGRRPLPDGGERGQPRRKTGTGSSRSARRASRLRDRSDDFALLALQGPRAQEILQGLTALDLPKLAFYHFAEGAVAATPRSRRPDGLHGRGRVRDLRRPGPGRGALAPADRGRGLRRPRARGPGSARHPAARGQDVPLRERHRRDHHPRRGGPRLDRLARRGEGRLHRPGRCSRSRSARERRESSWASR